MSLLLFGYGKPCRFPGCANIVPPKKGSRRVYCSVLCRGRANELVRERAPKETFHRLCRFCGTPFSTSCRRKVWCADKCWQRAYYSGSNAEKRRLPDVNVERKCGHCSSTFLVRARSRRKSEYCTRHCRNLAAYQRRKQRWAS